MTAQTTAQTQAPARPALTPVRGGVLQRACTCGQHTGGSGGECEECKKKREGTLQRAAISASTLPQVPESVHETLHSPGQTLEANTRSAMETHFGHDFSRVRVHTDAKAAESARAVNALAYTVGTDVVFDTGQYTPATSTGKRLLAHELTHVVQQSLGAGPSTPLRIAAHNDPAEREAELGAQAVLRGQLPFAAPRPQALNTL